MNVVFQKNDGEKTKGKIVRSYKEQTGEILYVIESSSSHSPLYVAICIKDILGQYIEYRP